MKYIGFDVGTKRIGVARGDDAVKMAFPWKIISVAPSLVSDIFSLCNEYRPDAFVVGLPSSGVGVENSHIKNIQKFIKTLEGEFGIPVHRVNEYGTSHHAKLFRNTLGGDRYDTASHKSIQKDHTDDSAAALILQRFLESAPIHTDN